MDGSSRAPENGSNSGTAFLDGPRFPFLITLAVLRLGAETRGLVYLARQTSPSTSPLSTWSLPLPAKWRQVVTTRRAVPHVVVRALVSSQPVQTSVSWQNRTEIKSGWVVGWLTPTLLSGWCVPGHVFRLDRRASLASSWSVAQGMPGPLFERTILRASSRRRHSRLLGPGRDSVASLSTFTARREEDPAHITIPPSPVEVPKRPRGGAGRTMWSWFSGGFVAGSPLLSGY